MHINFNNANHILLIANLFVESIRYKENCHAFLLSLNKLISIFRREGKTETGKNILKYQFTRRDRIIALVGLPNWLNASFKPIMNNVQLITRQFAAAHVH